MHAFLSVATQWRMVGTASGKIIATGLDYKAVKAGFKLAKIKVGADLWTSIRIIESAAMAAINEESP